MSGPRIAVIGGGITGLAAAYELHDDADVTLFEGEDRLGGKVRTEELDGIQIEAGPDSLLARDDEPIKLLHELGLGSEIVEPSDFGAAIATPRGLRPLPANSVLGIPTSPVALATSGLLSPRGVLRASADFFLPKTEVGDDTSVGRLVRARFGDQVTERIVAPLMAGIRAGDIDEMSLEMAAPQIAQVARRSRSLALGLRRAGRSAARPRFIGLRRGMSSLVDALANAAGAEIRLGTAVDSCTDLTIAGERFDGVVVALPPHSAAAVVAAPDLASVESASVSVMNLVYEPGAVSTSPGSGILVTPSMDKALVACTWFSKKWPLTAPADGRVVVRCVASIDATEETVVRELGEIAGIGPPPLETRVHRWERALPRFKVGHRELIAKVQQELNATPVRIAGAGYLATGLNDCLAHGRAAAREVLNGIRS